MKLNSMRPLLPGVHIRPNYPTHNLDNSWVTVIILSCHVTHLATLVLGGIVLRKNEQLQLFKSNFLYKH